MIFVEGISDKKILESLFSSLIEEKRKTGTYVSFHEAPAGNKKASVLNKVPIKACDYIAHNSDHWVVAMPDLYPKNVGFPHESFDDLEKGLHEKCLQRLRQKNVKDPTYCLNRFKVFCFKHDMEVLLLAAKNEMMAYLKIQNLRTSWIEPVEDQNFDTPPKRIVEKIFAENGSSYKEVVDATAILDGVHYDFLAERCPQCFKPFVEFLKGL
ncbi:MAG: DUF4276 family protein [Saprospiraceae bacterium]|nr:DUF4276 family protein [Saprospiraceae bacterium]